MDDETFIEAADEPKFQEFLSTYMYFISKYDAADFMQEMINRLLLNKKFDEMSEEDKSRLFAATCVESQRIGQVVHDSLFPFGHSGEQLEIEA